MRRIAIVSDIHYAGPREHAHGRDFEFAGLPPSFGKSTAMLFRNFIWMRNPVGNNHLLDRFIERAGTPDFVIANGDYTCDVAGFGVAHDEALESVQFCLGKLRAHFGGRLHAIMGDHELGKVTLLGDRGGLRLQAWHRATGECGLHPFWRVEVGNFVLVGVTSTLIGLPMMHRDVLDAEWPGWEKLRAAHLAEIRAAFAALQPHQHVLLFCHDPSALPYLWRDEAVRAKLAQVSHTIVGHLHTRILMWKTRLLSGMPPLRGCGVSLRRMTSALSEAKHWRPFNVVLCPSLAGIQMLSGGGYMTIDLDETAAHPPRITVHHLPRKLSGG